MEKGSHGYGERSEGRYHTLANEEVWHDISLRRRGRNHGALIRRPCANTHMRDIDLMADFDLDNEDLNFRHILFSMRQPPCLLESLLSPVVYIREKSVATLRPFRALA